MLRRVRSPFSKSLAVLTIVAGMCVAIAETAPQAGQTVPSVVTSPPNQTLRVHPMVRRVRTAATPVRTAATCVSVPVLVYHYIRVNPDPLDRLGWGLSVTPADFQQQMDWMRIAGGHPVTLAQLFAAMQGGPPLPPHPVVLTFDDGYADFATAAVPVLLREGFVATDFVVSGFIGRPGYMTAAQVLQVASLGMVIGAHTVHHIDLDAVPPQLAAIEIDASKATLQQLLHRQVLDFAYPYGDVDAVVADTVAAAGFRDAVTMNAGTLQCTASRYLLYRIRVGGWDTVWSFSHNAGLASPPAGWIDPSLLEAFPAARRIR
ncbi:MAG: polysaccharide deacetylase family protein [Candidatus Dormibacteraeota bacterium]|nr:polysaccharide deacetylase family protein [Candidatus Dormibacteraeota bacterium]MBV8445360.1 polysaccharide deacetylase family protein [Candidatus Dormibacteraeota bacterium]